MIFFWDLFFFFLCQFFGACTMVNHHPSWERNKDYTLPKFNGWFTWKWYPAIGVLGSIVKLGECKVLKTRPLNNTHPKAKSNYIYIHISSLTSKTCQISLRVEKTDPARNIRNQTKPRIPLKFFCCFILGRPNLHVEKTAAHVSILGWMIFFCFKFRWSWGCVFFSEKTISTCQT